MREVLYHASCADGFGAAYVCWKKYVQQGNETAIRFRPVQYGRPIPEIEDGSDVVIVDFSYPHEDLEALRSRSRSLLVIDHHASAEREIGGEPYAVFDQTRSGAVLTWQTLFPEAPIPELLLYVEDRDLWNWEMPWSREFSAGLRLCEFDFELWDYIAESADEREAISREGAVILSYMRQEIARKIRRAGWLQLGKMMLPCLNETTWISETCEALLEDHPQAPAAATFFIRPDGSYVVSLRTRLDRGCDVSRLAESQGGGGHPCAAGFKADHLRLFSLAPTMTEEARQ